MKNIVILLFLGLTAQLSAQCSFTPTISGDSILCPNSTGILSTQTYDSVQWYSRVYGSNPGSETPIAGATTSIHNINTSNDLLYYFSVDASLAGCTERSAEILVDGWNFLLPTVMTTGDFTIGGNGETIVCIGDTVYFELMQPYNTNIVWTKSGNAIPGADSTVLMVVSAGSYSVSGAPDICPNFVQFLGVTLDVELIDCSTGISDTEKTDNTASLFPNPAADIAHISWAQPVTAADIRLLNALGQTVWSLTSFSGTQLDLPTSALETGIYLVEMHYDGQKSIKTLYIID